MIIRKIDMNKKVNSHQHFNIKRKQLLKCKRSQQEIMGFVLIVMIIIIVGVVFLGISLRKKPVIDTENIEISDFLTTSIKYTTDCVLTEPLPADLKEIVGGCYSSRSCLDERTACDVLNQTLMGILNSPSLLKAGSDRATKYNNLLIYYQTDLEDPSSKDNIIELESGDSSLCVVNRAGRYIIPRHPGNLIVELHSCS